MRHHAHGLHDIRFNLAKLLLQFEHPFDTLIEIHGQGKRIKYLILTPQIGGYRVCWNTGNQIYRNIQVGKALEERALVGKNNLGFPAAFLKTGCKIYQVNLCPTNLRGFIEKEDFVIHWREGSVCVNELLPTIPLKSTQLPLRY